MCGISVTVSLFCDPREFAAGEDERRHLLDVYIREKERKKKEKRKWYTAWEWVARFLVWWNALKSSSGTIIALELISLARYNAVSCNCTFTSGIIDSQGTGRSVRVRERERERERFNGARNRERSALSSSGIIYAIRVVWNAWHTCTHRHCSI